MGARVRRLEVVRVVGAAHSHPEGAGDAEGPLGHPDLIGEAVRLDLREVVVAAEDVRVPAGDLERLPLLPGEEQARHLGVEAPGQDQEALRVLGQELLVHPRLVVEPLEVPLRDELDEVAVARLVPDEGGDVVRALVLPVDRGALEPAARGDVELAAEDGLDAGGARVLVEVDRPEHVAVVGQRDGREAEPGGPLDQPLQARGAVEEAVLRVDVEVDEVGLGRHGALSRGPDEVTCSRRSALPGAAGEEPEHHPEPAGNAAEDQQQPPEPRQPAEAVGGPRPSAMPGRIRATIGSAARRIGWPTSGAAAARRSA